MKTNLMYPKIPYGGYPLDRCIAFEKYDGTNLHWYWEDGWQTFGTRRTVFVFDDPGYQEFCSEHPGLEEAYPLFLKELAPLLENRLIGPTYIHTEFWGEKSFAGQHEPKDLKHLTLIDVEMDSILSPDKFLRMFGDLPQIARVVYQGKFTGRFTQDISMNMFNLNEGVVCKGSKNGKVYMAKYKTKNYLSRK